MPELKSTESKPSFEKLVKSLEDAKDPPDPKKGSDPKKEAAKVEVVKPDSAELSKRAWDVWWSSLSSEQQKGFADMIMQDVAIVKLSEELKFDPRGSVRISRTTTRDEQGRPVVAMSSSDPAIGQDILSSMESEYTVHNRSTGSFKLEDLTDRRLLVEKPSGSEQLKPEAEKKAEDKPKEVK